MKQAKICVLCGKPYYGCGNNAMPVALGDCCDHCDHLIVLPARLAAVTGRPPSEFMDIVKDIHAQSKLWTTIHKARHSGNGNGN